MYSGTKGLHNFDMETCVEEKKKFEDCFKEWLSNGVLTGNFGNPCSNEWNIYEKCLNKELKEKNLLDLKPFTMDPNCESITKNKDSNDINIDKKKSKCLSFISSIFKK